MNDEPVDWEKEKLIKAEKEKAEKAMTPESKSNLADIDPSVFKDKRGFSNTPTSFYKTGEKMANTSIALAVLGGIGVIITRLVTTGVALGGNGGEKRAENYAVSTATGIIGTIFAILLVIALVLGICGVIAGIVYRVKSGKNAWHIIIAGAASVVIYLFLTFF
jgi:hypothetical protein